MKLLAGVIVSEYAGDLCVCVKLECCFFTLSLLTPRVKKWGGNDSAGIWVFKRRNSVVLLVERE